MNNKIIAITGVSGTGKTTLANSLSTYLDNALIISTDNYYKPLPPSIEPKKYDFDSINAIDMKLLNSNIKSLKMGRITKIPQWNPVMVSRHKNLTVIPTNIIIIEGIHALCNAENRRLIDYSIFIESPLHVQLARRIIRDENIYKRSVNYSIEQFFKYTIPAQIKNLYPYKDYTNLVLDNNWETPLDELLINIKKCI